MNRKDLEAAVLRKLKALGIDGQADASVRFQANSNGITIIKFDDHEFVGESPYPSQNKHFVDWAKGRSFVASASITKTGRSKHSADGVNYPIEQITLKFK